MPNRRHFPKREEDPFRRIKNWDDGYSSQLSSPPLHTATGPEPWEWSSPRRQIGRDSIDHPARSRYPSPKPLSDEYSRRRRDPSPIYRRAARSPSPPPRRRDADSPPPRYRAGGPSTRAASPPRRRAYSPSPPRLRPRDLDSLPARNSRYSTASPPPRSTRAAARPSYLSRSPSPPPPSSRSRYPTTTQPRPRARSHAGGDRDRYSAANGPTSPPPQSQQPQPTTGSTGRSNSKRDAARRRLPDLKNLSISERWQKAAKAAIQAGGMAALEQRAQPGAWKGEKGARVASAALGAAVGPVMDGGIPFERLRRGRRGRGGGGD